MLWFSHPAFWPSHSLGTWVLGYLGTWVLGYLGTWVLGYLGIWVFGYFVVEWHAPLASSLRKKLKRVPYVACAIMLRREQYVTV
ncbi:MAG: hypothetical protein ACI9OU_000200, partial [Candidatus Promineifilaceae bacterium]